MNREDIEKLLGGYATGSLSAEERQRLFEAALEDQEIFEALAREQDFKDLLETPGAREELLVALEGEPALAGMAMAAAPAAARPAPVPEQKSFWSWLTQPWPWAVAATAAFSAILFFALRPQPKAIETAAVREEPAKPAERAAAKAPEPFVGLGPTSEAPEASRAKTRAQAPAPLRPKAAPPAGAASGGGASEAPGETKKIVAANVGLAEQAEKSKAEAARPVAEADRKAAASSDLAMAPPSPRKEMPPGAVVQPPLRDDIARGAASAPKAVPLPQNQAAVLRYRLGAPAFQPGKDIEVFVTASRAGRVVVRRRSPEGWESVLSMSVSENAETRIAVPTREGDRELELDLSLVDANRLGASAGFRRAEQEDSRPGVRIRIPRAE